MFSEAPAQTSLLATLDSCLRLASPFTIPPLDSSTPPPCLTLPPNPQFCPSRFVSAFCLRGCRGFFPFLTIFCVHPLHKLSWPFSKTHSTIMDIQTPLIVVGIFSVGSVLLFLIYKFGMKEKSYEEALAEQRQHTQILLGTRPKPKEKKNKKAQKKIRKENEEVDDNDAAESVHSDTSDTNKKPHVEFKDVPEEFPLKNVAVNTSTKNKQLKSDKTRPILLNKEKSSEAVKVAVAAAAVEPANNFLQVQPKDEFELKRSNSRDSLMKHQDDAKTTNNKSSKTKQSKPEPSEAPKDAKKLEVIQKGNGVVLLAPKTLTVAPPINNTNNLQRPAASVAIGNTGKEKKKKKSEYNTLQQLAAGDSNGPNMSVLLNLVRKAELSRSEVQILIDLLLNKQHEAPEVVDEWSEGKSDPVQKLKKQLAEKEKLLAEEQQVASSAQMKLREIRGEFQAEKLQLQQKLRQYEETLHGKQIENSRILQQLQQLQTQVKEEIMKNHKLREEQAAVQMQRGQFEMHLAKLQENEVIINKLQGENRELLEINGHMRGECARLTEENATEKERQQSIIVKIGIYQKELEQMNERNKFLEENRHDIERTIEKALTQENDLKSEISHLNTLVQQKLEEVRRVEHSKKQFQDELQKSKDESCKIIAQLKSELQKLQDEKMTIQSTHVNGVSEEHKQQEIKILNLQNELSSLKTELVQAEKKYRDELKSVDGTVTKLKKEVEEERAKLQDQISKNNELRTKNWKVMEALNAAESRIKSNFSSYHNNVQQAKLDEDVHKQFILRLFPDIKELRNINPDTFHTESEIVIQKYIAELKQQQQQREQRHQNEESTDESTEVASLKSQLRHYKTVIDDTEKILIKLQKHIEQEEINWRREIAAKNAEIEALKENQVVHEKLANSDGRESKEEQTDKIRQLDEFKEVKSRGDIGEAQNGLK